jgi:hypothetical protein
MSHDWVEEDMVGLMQQLDVIPARQMATPWRLRTTKSSSSKHADEAHPELGLTDEQLRGIIAETAYDK